MQPGVASRTAVVVCMGRAASHGRTTAPRFSDPTALALLPDDARRHVELQRAGSWALTPRAIFMRAMISAQMPLMTARTVAIDDAVRAGPAGSQVVILGAGLDGRAWRMPELAGRVVFEVDHPDTQRDKRARTAVLSLVAAEVRFVAVDFTRDSLDERLESAGHDPAKPTIWIWEGVIMYLDPGAVNATLDVVKRRSAPTSTLIALYCEPKWSARFIGLTVALLGEPYRSRYTPAEMRGVLAERALLVDADLDVPAWARAAGISDSDPLVRVSADRLVVATLR